MCIKSSPHHYEGVISECVISHGSNEFTIDLLADTGFDGELMLPAAKCQQLGLTASDSYQVDIFGQKVETITEYKEQILLTVTMDDGTKISSYVLVTSASPSYSAATSTSSSSSDALYNVSSSSEEEQASISATTTFSTSSFTSSTSIKHLSPVKFQPDPNQQTKYQLNECLLGFVGLRRLKLGVDPARRCLAPIIIRHRHIRF